MGRFYEFCELVGHHRLAFLFILGVGLLQRICVGLHSYSGEGTPPKYGDYEAQRHWMEVTLHTPIRQWYTNTSDNNLEYWGLDYPPLTAYQSLLHGRMVRLFDPEAVALGTSHGYETPYSKLLMRWTVISSDVLVFFPAAVAFVLVFVKQRSRGCQLWVLAMLVLQPALVLIDHGHFQYNCISLGFTLGAVAAIGAGREVAGSVLFCLSLNHKQMSMYYAPAIFGHLLGRCLRRQRPVVAIAKLALTVVVTFGVIWWPYLHSLSSVLEVLGRLAPLQRGLYEDHVANFWCATSAVIKWKRLFPVARLVPMALGLTVAGVAPAMVREILNPTRKGLQLALLNSSFAFFLFSFQVHEKSVLLPLLPATMLALEEPDLLMWLLPHATFSMYPLLKRDGLSLPYFAAVLFYALISSPPPQSLRGIPPGHPVEAEITPDRTMAAGSASTKTDVPPGSWPARWHLWQRYVAMVSLAGALILHAGDVWIKAPSSLPYLHQALFITFAFVHFVPIALYCNWRQWQLPAELLDFESSTKLKAE